jgi:hypothetical protein
MLGQYKKSILETMIALVLGALAPAALAQSTDMISINPNTGNITVDKLSRLAAGISDPAAQMRFLATDYHQKELEVELKNSLSRVEKDFDSINKFHQRGQTGLADSEMTRLETDIQSYQTAQKFAQKYGRTDLKFKTSLRMMTNRGGPLAGTTEVNIEYGGTGEKSTRMTLSKDFMRAISSRGLLNQVSNPGSTQEMQTFKPVAEAIRMPIGGVANESPSARPQCDSCTTGGLWTEVIH